MRAYIALGSNLGDRMGNLRAALEQMRDRGVQVLAVSPVYETDPVGPAQPDYLNAVARVETRMSAPALLSALKAAEAAIGRKHRARWGPREIDLDILLCDGIVIDTKGLQVPHPALTERPFVLVPLLSLDPDIALPSGEPLARFLPAQPSGVTLYGDLEESV